MKYRHDTRLIILTVNGTHVGLQKNTQNSNSKNKRLLKQNDKGRN